MDLRPFIFPRWRPQWLGLSCPLKIRRKRRETKVITISQSDWFYGEGIKAGTYARLQGPIHTGYGRYRNGPDRTETDSRSTRTGSDRNGLNTYLDLLAPNYPDRIRQDRTEMDSRNTYLDRTEPDRTQENTETGRVGHQNVNDVMYLRRRREIVKIMPWVSFTSCTF